jgi:hypothetical protein
MIIHITGPSGSGKSSLIKNLTDKFKTKSVIILDTDIVDDSHALKLLKNAKVKNHIINGNINYFFNLKDKLNKQYLVNFIDKHKKSMIIIVGLSFGNLPKFYAAHKFCIKIDPIKIYKRVYLRTLYEICDEEKQLEKLLKSNEHPSIIKILAVHKYHLWQDFIGPYFPDLLIEFYNEHKKNQYVVLTSEEILAKVYHIYDQYHKNMK